MRGAPDVAVRSSLAKSVSPIPSKGDGGWSHSAGHDEPHPRPCWKGVWQEALREVREESGCNQRRQMIISSAASSVDPIDVSDCD
jgi:hypothetical protein